MSQHERVLLVDSSGNPIITVPFQFDDTDKLAVSVYGKKTVSGDTPIKLATGGEVVAVYPNRDTNQDNYNLGFAFTEAPDGIGALPANTLFVANQNDRWDRYHNNTEITLLASAARTAQVDSSDQTNFNHQGMILFVDVTVDAAAGAITPNIAVKDPVSGTAKVIWSAAAAIAATGQFVYLLLPGAADAGSYTEQKELAIPRDWFFRMTVADADSLTYSVSCCML